MFKVGHEYNRRADIHEPYGGQRYGGIATPRSIKSVLLFTSDAGQQHGYRDEYRDDGVFWYTGEGQLGDMTMTAGNRAILEHRDDGKDLRVFESIRTGFVRYLGSAECLGFHVETRPDRNGDDRKAFVFHLDIDSAPNKLRVAEERGEYGARDVRQLKRMTIQELRAAAVQKASTAVSKTKRREIAYYRSEALKVYVVLRAKGVCEGCLSDAPFKAKSGPYLECHHLHRLADGGPDHPENVVALCPNCHRRAHYALDAIAFNEKLKTIALEAEKNAK